jgi:hypothetical protein
MRVLTNKKYHAIDKKKVPRGKDLAPMEIKWNTPNLYDE